MMLWIGLHKLADVISGVTQKPLNIPLLYVTNKGIFWACFVTWRTTGYEFQAPFVFNYLVHLKELGSKENIDLTFSKLFDNTRLKCRIFKRIFYMQL